MSTNPRLLKKIRITVVAADGLSKRDIFRLPDPFALIMVDADQTHTTSVVKKTLNPYWNESFDITISDSSVVVVQIFDQRKFNRQDQGFLGVVNVKVSDVLDLELGGHEMLTLDLKKSNDNLIVHGKLIIYLSTNISQPISNSGPPQVNGLSNALEEMSLDSSPTARSSNLPSQPRSVYLGRQVSLMPWQICRRLETILEAKPLYTEFLALRGPNAQSMINLLHQLLDITDLQAPSRSNLTKALIRLSKSASLYPSCLVLKETLRLGDHPEAGGGFGDVWKGTIFGQEVGVKVIRVYRKSDAEALLKSFYREAIVWSQFNHPNILPFYGIYFLDQEQRRLGLVSPWITNGNITHYLAENSQVDRPPLILDVADGLAYLHRMSIVHGDLKPANILVTTSGRACLMDFGMSTVDDPGVLALTSSSAHGGTMRYTAPEIFDGSSNSQAADIYSFAYVCHEVFTGAHVFSRLNDAVIMYRVKHEGLRPSRPDSSQLIDNMWDLMQCCWHADPALRPNAEVIAELIRSTCIDNRPPSVDWDESFPKILRGSLRGKPIVISEDELNEMLPKVTN